MKGEVLLHLFVASLASTSTSEPVDSECEQKKDFFCVEFFVRKWKSSALCVKPLRNLALQGFAKMIPSAPIFPLSLSNSLSSASIPIVKIGKNYENFNFQTLNPFSQWRAALTNFSFSRYSLKKFSFFSTKKIKFVGPALLFFGQKCPIYWYFSGGKIFVGKYLQFVNFWKRIEMFSSKNEHTLILLLLNVCIFYNAMA